MQREILRQLDPSYLKTVSMTTLYDCKCYYENVRKFRNGNVGI
jgi:hypothetical protein